MYVNQLNVNRNAVYNSQTNAAGDTVVDLLCAKREIEVGIIPLNSDVMAQLLDAIYPVDVFISFRNPRTKEVETVHCMIPESNVEYYTIQANKVMYNAFTLTFIEL